jgi:hypothetical protein
MPERGASHEAANTETRVKHTDDQQNPGNHKKPGS